MLNHLYAPKKMLLLASAAILLACGPALGVIVAQLCVAAASR